MLEYMRRTAGGPVIQTGIALIVVVFVFWVGYPRGDRIADAAVVNGIRITDRQVQQQQIRLLNQQRALGIDVDQSQAAAIRTQALAQLIDRTVALQEAERGGYVISDLELGRSLREDQRFYDNDGRFDLDAYRGAFNDDERRITMFEKERRENMMIANLENVIRRSIQVSAADVRDAFETQELELDVEYVRVTRSSFRGDSTPSDEEVEAWLTEEGAPEAQAYYDENRERRYEEGAKVRARHILMKYEPEATDDAKAAIRTQMEQVLARAQAGEDFASLAQEYSEDGSASSGGDLGFFTRERMVAPFSEAAFNLEPGQISELVETRFGLHIIKTEEAQDATSQTFDEVRMDIGRQLLADGQASEAAAAFAQQVADAFASGDDTATMLEEAGIDVSSTGPFKPGEGRIPGLGNDPELIGAITQLDELGLGPDRVFEVPGGWAAVRLQSRVEPDESTWEERRPQLETQLRRGRQASVLRAWRDSWKSQADIGFGAPQ